MQIRIFFIGLIEIVDERADAVTISREITNKLHEYGLDFDQIKFFTADGAKVNSKLARIAGKKMQACQNHGIHLGNFC